jgi:hypothetical protein
MGKAKKKQGNRSGNPALAAAVAVWHPLIMMNCVYSISESLPWLGPQHQE